ncbi:MAG TPA: glycosyltransferase family 4 protein [Candidatus Dormibacteraeota bacterium]|nr:glycosyltransferase family 4 protein [Candidatus Dormibacteraeota bacterium]
MPDRNTLRVALLAYRGNPYSGGQGVYVSHLSAALTRLGHEVTVFAGQPYPVLTDGLPLVRVPSLDLYREDDPFRVPRLSEFRDWIDVLEYLTLCTAAFPEPLTFSLRARRLLLARRAQFDVVHDNQCLGWGVLGLHNAGVPVVASVHHAVVIDRDLELAREVRLRRRLTLRRWYQFHHMQDRVARRLPRVITVSTQSRRDIVERMRVDPARVRVIPVAVDDTVFAPRPGTARVRGRIFAIASADVPLKGVVPLLHAVAALRVRRPVELVLLGEARRGGAVERTMRELGLNGTVRFARGIDDAAVAEQYAEAEVAVVPSLYEGFSIPAVQAMSCGVPLVATTAGALPEVVGRDGETALLVPPGDAAALAQAIGRLLDDPVLRTRLSAAALQRAAERYSWEATARATADVYREVLADPVPCRA